MKLSERNLLLIPFFRPYLYKNRMKVEEICDLLKARIICGKERKLSEIEKGFSSDLMSDVLTLDTDNLLLITGLCNLQTIRTAEMADIRYIIFGRNKKIDGGMIELAKENNMCLIESSYSLFRISGILFEAGLKPVY